MTRVTTAMLMAGPRSLSPWGDRAWRVALTAQLVEGGSSAYWLATPTQPAAYEVKPDAINIETPDLDGMIDSTLIMLALHLGEANVEGYLYETHNLRVGNSGRWLAPYWELSEDGRDRLAKYLSPNVRIGLTLLEDTTMFLLAYQGLVSLGFDVDVFAPVTPGVLAMVDDNGSNI